MAELLSRYPFEGLEPEIHLLKGEETDLIPSFAAKKRVGLLVMGAVWRTGVEGFLARSTAEAVLEQVHCSVLTVNLAASNHPGTFN